VAGHAAEAGARVARFALRVLAWGAAAFVAWHLAATPLSAACGWIAARVIERTAPVEAVRTRVRDREVLFDIAPDYETSRRRSLAPGTRLEASGSALLYLYGVPFFLALVLASWPRGLAWKAVAGSLVVLIAAGAGLAMGVLLQLATSGVLAFGGMAREAFALGYQLATLMLPTLVPALLWIALDWRGVLRLAGREAEGPGDSPGLERTTPPAGDVAGR